MGPVPPVPRGSASISLTRVPHLLQVLAPHFPPPPQNFWGCLSPLLPSEGASTFWTPVILPHCTFLGSILLQDTLLEMVLFIHNLTS